MFIWEIANFFLIDILYLFLIFYFYLMISLIDKLFLFTGIILVIFN